MAIRVDLEEHEWGILLKRLNPYEDQRREAIALRVSAQVANAKEDARRYKAAEGEQAVYDAQRATNLEARRALIDATEQHHREVEIEARERKAEADQKRNADAIERHERNVGGV